MHYLTKLVPNNYYYCTSGKKKPYGILEALHIEDGCSALQIERQAG
jgi:hypothetical protein